MFPPFWPWPDIPFILHSVRLSLIGIVLYFINDEIWLYKELRKTRVGEGEKSVKGARFRLGVYK